MIAWIVFGKTLRRFKKANRRILIFCLLILSSLYSIAQEDKSNVEVYGFIMTDIGYNFQTMDPNWFDAMRPVKLPSYKGEFAPEGNIFFSIRQTRLGVRSNTKIGDKELKTEFQFDLYGFGKDMGQTTFHVITCFAEYGKMLAGQAPSVLMDMDAVPLTLDYWGPMARVFNFNIQLRYVPISSQKERLMFSIERPGARADGGDEATSLELAQVKAVHPMPNIVAHYRRKWDWGHIQLGSIFKLMQWSDMAATPTKDLSGSTIGWGWTLSTVVNAGNKLKFKCQLTQGNGIQSYIADAPADVVPKSNPSDPMRPIKGVAQPLFGFYSFAEIKWNRYWESTVGYSIESVNNSDLQATTAFRKGHYGLVNLRFLPYKNIMMGAEYQYGRRENYNSDFHSYANKIQLSFKYNFSRNND